MKLPIGKIICGNCVNVMEAWPDNCIDLVVIDPPYYGVINDKYDNQWKNEKEFIEFQKSWLIQCVRILKDSGSIYFFGSLKNNALLQIKLWLDKYLIFKNWITWNKPVRMQSGKYNFVNRREEILYYVKSKNYFFCNPRGLRYTKGNSGISQKSMVYFRNNEPPYDKNIVDAVQRQIILTAKKRNWKNKSQNLKKMININGKLIGNIISHISDKIEGSAGTKLHEAEKPTKLMEMFIKASSKEGDIVLDPMCGSGTTCFAAKELNRKYIGIDISKNFCMLTKKRLDTISRYFDIIEAAEKLKSSDFADLM